MAKDENDSCYWPFNASLFILLTPPPRIPSIERRRPLSATAAPARNLLDLPYH